jgi:16S rRNA processing protein RimM
MNDVIPLGYICRAFGIKGGVVVKLFNGHSQSLLPKKTLITHHNGAERRLIIESISDDGRLFLEEIVERTQAEALVGCELLMERADLPEALDDEFYLFDLQGARVVDVEGCLVGFVVGFSSNNAQDLLEVKTPSGSIVSIPSVKPIVTKIDCDNKIVTIDPPSGLLDLVA